METWETLTMSRKEVPRAGLLKAALAGRITTQQGATALRPSVRQFQRLKHRFREGGARALLHRNRGQPSPRRLSAAVRQRVAELLQTTYQGFNDCHATEKLREVEALPLSRASVRRLRRALGLPPKHRRRPRRHRTRRTPEAQMGALVQLDGSPFDWLEGRGPAMTLLGAIDDATGTVLALHFRPTEDLQGYTTLLHQLGRQWGLPLALYGDRLNVFVRNDRHWTLEEELQGAQAPTHFGRMLQDLGIGYVPAGSPQAKGRIERLWGTLQDRLVSELRLRGLAALDAANASLPEFVADFNRRFAHAPAEATAAWRRTPRDFAELLSCRYERVVARDNTVRLGARWLQIPRGPGGRSSARCRVELRECLDGRLIVFHDVAALGPEFVLRPRGAPPDLETAGIGQHGEEKQKGGREEQVRQSDVAATRGAGPFPARQGGRKGNDLAAYPHLKGLGAKCQQPEVAQVSATRGRYGARKKVL
ncbi:MAG: ISNCY family transposase [Candidatus Rokubacteria bacterium]|nr:ISNCY family transposase [Candidatus Rokubacteria bacterium]